ncbi:MAG: hypothetical protein F4004_08390 [Acidimicrobiia bacterium]|nr:hypothetical protein [Acidimicrobiia bacterium]MYC45384.1 hypothetical protein [Acidimicrobiia bacterium]
MTDRPALRSSSAGRPVAAGPLPRGARRPQPRRARRRTRVLVCTLAALIATLAPVESPVPLGPLESLAGSTPAEAQSSAVTPGMPDSCTLPWREDPNDASLCVLSEPACSEHPILDNSYLTPSDDFPDFCEATVLEDPADPDPYTRCTALTGYVIKTSMVGGDQACRMIHPTQCPQNLHRTGSNTCRQVRRRTWSCPSGTPTNRFNTCYQAPVDYTGTHPACGSGAPSFALSNCESYVGQDFVRAPASLPCGNFDTGYSSSALRDLTSPPNAYWCRFDSSYLDVGCYATGATCTTSDAVCIKRASTTGGCNAIADALRCRKLQADFLDGSLDAEDVYLEGCVPCAVLPFSPTSLDCPRDLRVNPSLSSISRLETAHQNRYDSGPGGSRATFCADPPPGRLVWESSHHAGLAIVNSSVVLRVIDSSVTNRPVEYIRVSLGGGVRFGVSRRLYFEYPGSTASDPIVRAWPTFDTSLAYRDVDEIVGGYRSGSIIFNSGPCLVRALPDFRLRVEELWPDSDASDIRALFGADALDWWTALGSVEQAAHLARRTGSLTQEVRCNYGSDVWCNWRPTRPGYYRLVAAGAWYMTKFGGKRTWANALTRALIDNALMDMESAKDGVCRRRPGHSSHSDYECLIEDLARIGVTTPAEAGLLPDLRGLLPAGSSEEWLYTDAAGSTVTCPPRDLRVHCGGTGESLNYTETEPIGILVHEMRVSTVAPDG